MNVAAPLRWPFPFVPFITEANQEILQSPVPIIGTLFERKEVNAMNGDKVSHFYSMWNKETENSTASIHFNIDTNLHFGKCKADLKTFLGKTNYMKEMKDVRAEILKKIGEDFMLKNLYMPRYKELIKLLRQFIEIFKRIVHEIYFENLDFTLIDRSDLECFGKIRENILKESKFPIESHRALLESQAFQLFLESNVFSQTYKRSMSDTSNNSQ